MKKILVASLFFIGCNQQQTDLSKQSAEEIIQTDKAMSDEAAKNGFYKTLLSYADDSVVKPQDLPNLMFGYKPSSLSMINNGHTVQMNYDAGSTLGRTGSSDSSTSTLAQFHFHAPSEHTVDGASFPMEAHLVHVNAAGKPVAVVGVFIKTGKENAGLTKAFQGLPAKSGDKSAPDGATIDARTLLPADKTFFTYAGSLTTPPCTEGLTWYVFKTPIEMSPAQIGAFTKLEHLGHTNRPVQSLGGRVVLVDSTPGK